MSSFGGGGDFAESREEAEVEAREEAGEEAGIVFVGVELVRPSL